MAARKPRQPKFAMSDEHRIKIGNSNILNNLIKHADGKLDMSSTQVQVGLGLLKKVMPDLQAITLDAKIDASITIESPKDKLSGFLDDIAKRGGETS